jgi:hypothetical protein
MHAFVTDQRVAVFNQPLTTGEVWHCSLELLLNVIDMLGLIMTRFETLPVHLLSY